MPLIARKGLQWAYKIALQNLHFEIFSFRERERERERKERKKEREREKTLDFI